MTSCTLEKSGFTGNWLVVVKRLKNYCGLIVIWAMELFWFDSASLSSAITVFRFGEKAEQIIAA